MRLPAANTAYAVVLRLLRLLLQSGLDNKDSELDRQQSVRCALCIAVKKFGI